MLPSATADNVADGLFTNAVALTKFFVSETMLCKLFANRTHDFIGQFRLRSCLATRSAFLFRAVAHIVGLRADGKVSGIHTPRVITTVKQMLSGGQGDAVMQFVAESMGVHLETARCIKPAITVFEWPRPKPAAFGFLDALPKENILRLLLRLCNASRRAKVASVALQLVRLPFKSLAANIAVQSDGCAPNSITASMATNRFVTGRKLSIAVFASAFHGYKYTIDAGV